MNAESSTPVQQDFSLVLGGPLYQLLLRVGLIRPPLNRVGARILVLVGVAWIPLLVLTLVDGTVVRGVRVPFLHDFEAQARLLVTLPLLIAAELVIHQRTSAIVQQFLERQIITEQTRARYQAILDSAVRIRNSVTIEVTLFVLVFVVGHLVWRGAISLHSDSWVASQGGADAGYTPAGRWYAYVSVPLVQFILLRWYFRLFLWGRFLWQASRLDLRLIATHPDRSCGLGFLGEVVIAQAPFLAAHSVLLAGFVANRVVHEGANLLGFKFEVVAVAAFLVVIALGPICVFAPAINRARLAGLRAYGRLASQYVLDFDRKWISSQKPEGEALLGSADIQSLADLANSFQIVQTIRAVPFGKETLIRLGLIIVIPLLPLALTVLSPEEIVKRLIKVVF